MRTDSKELEATRTEGLTIENYPWLHERHRIFPAIFENRKLWIMIVCFFAGLRLKADSIEIVTISLTVLFTSFSYDIAIKRPH